MQDMRYPKPIYSRYGDTQLEEGHLSQNDLDEIESLMRYRYLDLDWNYGESPEFNVKQAKRFNSGKIETLANVRTGSIRI